MASYPYDIELLNGDYINEKSMFGKEEILDDVEELADLLHCQSYEQLLS